MMPTATASRVPVAGQVAQLQGTGSQALGWFGATVAGAADPVGFAPDVVVTAGAPLVVLTAGAAGALVDVAGAAGVVLVGEAEADDLTCGCTASYQAWMVAASSFGCSTS